MDIRPNQINQPSQKVISFRDGTLGTNLITVELSILGRVGIYYEPDWTQLGLSETSLNWGKETKTIF